MVWVEFAICAVLMIAAAYALCLEGMVLASRTHIEEGVVGIFFLAVATSFPEIVVGVSSVACLDRVALGYGDLIGSVMINSMLIIGVDYYAGKGRVLAGVSEINFLAVLFWTGVAGVITAAAVLRRHFNVFAIGPIGLESFIILGLYFTYLIDLKKKSSAASKIKKENNIGSLGESQGKTVAGLWLKFLFLLFLVMILGVWMAFVGEKIAVSTGLSHTFVGATLLAVVTSFPEIAVTFGAMRAGSIDMALGNILGSNLFDLSILPILDVFTKGPITAGFTVGQIAVTAMAFLIPITLMVGMRSKISSNKRVGIDTAFVFASGLAGLAVLYFVD